MSREWRRSRALQRRQSIENKRAEQNRSGTIFSQVDQEKKASKEEKKRHNRKSSRIVKVALSVFFTWVLGGSFLIVTCMQLSQDRATVNARWESYLQSDAETEAEAHHLARQHDATKVTVGSYLENFKSLDVRNSSFRSVWIVWFSWENDDEIDFSDGQFIYYNGTINSLDVLKDIVTPEGVHYQQFRVDVTISQAFHTLRFPLENHLLRLYIEPVYSADEVLFINSDDVDNLNTNINVYSYQIERMSSTIKYISYSDTHDDPTLTEGLTEVLSEHMDEIEVNRTDWGLYVKCFIALWGTSLWVLIMLFVAIKHHVDVFSMIPATLFGAVGNIMIGANLLPEALGMGLLEYGNIWGIFIVLVGTIIITVLNRERNHWHEDAFADKYGRFMFASILALTIVGNIVLPLASYQF